METNTPMKPIKAPTMKEIMAMRKPYPYKEVAEQLNNIQNLTPEIMDRIIGMAEYESCNMVGIRKLCRMCKPEVQKLMRKEYQF